MLDAAGMALFSQDEEKYSSPQFIQLESPQLELTRALRAAGLSDDAMDDDEDSEI